jgi:hypothetical protein
MNKRKTSVTESMRKHMQAITAFKRFLTESDNYFILEQETDNEIHYAFEFMNSEFKNNLIKTYNNFLESYADIKYTSQAFVPEYDDEGNPKLDKKGNQKFQRETDKDGKVIKNEKGRSVYKTTKEYYSKNDGTKNYKYGIGRLNKDSKTLDKKVGRMTKEFAIRPTEDIIDRIFNSQNGINRADLEIQYAFMTYLRRNIPLMDKFFEFETGLKVARSIETIDSDGNKKIEKIDGFGLGEYSIEYTNEDEDEYDDETSKKKDPFYHSSKRYMMSDKVYLNKDSLNKNNLLEFRYTKNNHLSNIKPQIVTNEFKDIINGHILGTGIDHDMINKLSNQEKHFLKTLDNRFKMNMNLKDDDEDGMNSEYHILLGQYKAGNDATEIKLKLRKYIDYYVTIGKMSKYEANRLLHLLNI